ncbi:formate dehydrogenase subunit alpha [Desulfosarcina widdelii]|uniref:nitrate reductase (cytochrome) n=1 Tax=Desulfosarcina widdelii TaxID=947919 RepID=A0A5K7Z1C3_9BACT|nr:formate dehydrogenase subunit alpha [Desulfosarcina widdelii]BBO74708.1 formate dehydrogenase subunit alpha [Desulfosarcina widdelii]
MGPDFVKTICPYCGTGCGLILAVRNGQVVGCSPDRGHPVSKGALCIKGWTAREFIHHPERLTAPLLKKDGCFHEISWDEAIDLLVTRLRETVDRYGPRAVGGLCSARCTNEENYLFQKLIRIGLGSNNVDHCARLCHGPTVAAMGHALGSGAMTNPIADFAGTNFILAVGSNAAETFPVAMGELYRAREKGAQLVVIDPRTTEMAKNADLHLPLRPGTDIPLLSGMMHHILSSGLENRAFIEQRTEGFSELAAYLDDWPPERAAQICGVAPELIRHVAEAYAQAPSAMIIFCMGITQHACGTANVYAVCDLALLCGQVGRPHAGICPLRGQCNVQGACDMGGLPDVLPGYQKVEDDWVRMRFEAHWGAALPKEAGMTVTAAMAADDSPIRAAYIMGENPVMSDPDRRHTIEFLENLDFLVVQDIFHTDTTRLADLVLPAACFAEKEGTFTNTERRVQRLRKAVQAPGSALDDLMILCRVGRAMGLDFNYADSAAVMDEIASLTPSYGGISYRRLQYKGLHWPCTDFDHPGTAVLHQKRFSRGRGLFVVPEYRPPQEAPDEHYPLVLITGRMFCHYHTGTMTRRSPSLHREVDKPFVEVNPKDAERRGICDGDRIRVETRRGAISTTARVVPKVAEGTIFAAFHFHEAPADALTNNALDPVSNVPEFKACAVEIAREGACPDR